MTTLTSTTGRPSAGASEAALLDPSYAAMAALAALQIKHLVCDFLLQTPYQVNNKGQYGHPGGLIHAAFHGFLTIPIFLFLPTTLGFGAAIVAAEMVLHYHIDWIKDGIVRRKGWTTQDAGFWQAIGIDQFAHQMTYLAMVLVLLLAR